MIRCHVVHLNKISFGLELSVFFRSHCRIHGYTKRYNGRVSAIKWKCFFPRTENEKVLPSFLFRSLFVFNSIKGEQLRSNAPQSVFNGGRHDLHFKLMYSFNLRSVGIKGAKMSVQIFFPLTLDLPMPLEIPFQPRLW